MFSTNPRGRTESRESEGEPSSHIRRNSRNGPRYSATPNNWESCYVDKFDDEDDENDYTTSTPSPSARRIHPGTFVNPWRQPPKPRSRSRTRRDSHTRTTSAWEDSASPVSPTTDDHYTRPNPTTRGRADSQSRRHSTAEATYGPSNPRNSRAQKRWERDYIRVFDKEYAEDNNPSPNNRRNTYPRPPPGGRRPAAPVDLRMSGALPVPPSTSSRPSRLSRHERQEQRARTAEWAAEDERRTPSARRAQARNNDEEEDSQLAEALRESLRTFEEDKEKARRRKRQSLTPWYRRRGAPGNSVDEALRERVARSVDEQNREIARRLGAKEQGQGQGQGGVGRKRRVRFPDD
ncbi:hypothetical protein B0T16DRAFT_409705, partial [Cercophora newfieldiana]